MIMLFRQYLILLGLSTLTQWITLRWSKRLETQIYRKKHARPHPVDHDISEIRDGLETLHGEAKRTVTRARHLFITTLAVSIPIGVFYEVAQHALPGVSTVAAYSAMTIMLIGIIASFIRRRTIVQRNQAIDHS